MKIEMKTILYASETRLLHLRKTKIKICLYETQKSFSYLLFERCVDRILSIDANVKNVKEHKQK